MFGASRRLIDVPNDPHIYFVGEEINLAVRLWTAGWDLFEPNRVLLYHHYAKPGARSAPWLDDRRSHLLHGPSVARLRYLFGKEQPTDRRALVSIERYGLGCARSLAAYEAFAGVSFRNRTVEKRARRGELRLPDGERINSPNAPHV